MRKYMVQGIFLLVGLVVFIKEVHDLLTTSIFSFPLNDELIFHYLKLLFYFFALPLFFVCETLELLGVIPEESANHYHIHLFYYLVYAMLTFYGFVFLVGSLSR